MITIKDVARRAGVAPGTVSNVLTGKRPVAPATRERVVLAVEELGYQPNILARSLVNRRSETLAVVATGLSFYGPSTMVVGVEQRANELGYSLLLHLLHWSEDARTPNLLRSLHARRVDGIVWAIPQVGNNRSWVTPGALAALPPIVFMSMAPEPGLSIVTPDNHAGAMQAVRHLAQEGRRHIGLIAGPGDWWSARERLAGWRAALLEAGLRPDPSLEIVGDWSTANGEAGARTLFERQPRLDAIAAASDQVALGALLAAHRCGIRVPDDLAVIGYDNQPLASFFWPPLSTINQHLLEVGRMAVDELHRIVTARQNGEPVEPQAAVLRTDLVVRESSRRQVSPVAVATVAPRVDL